MEAIAALAGGIALKFIQKPFTLDKLSEKLRAVWEIENYNQGGYDADKKNV